MMSKVNNAGKASGDNKIGRSGKRQIVVDGELYFWKAGRNSLYVWDGNQRRVAVGSGQQQYSGCGRFQMTPFHIANWIRINIQGKAAVSRVDSTGIQDSFPPIANHSNQQKSVYAVVRVFEWFDEDAWRTLDQESVLEVSLDPSYALLRAKDLNLFGSQQAPNFGEKFLQSESKLFKDRYYISNFCFYEEESIKQKFQEFCSQNCLLDPEKQLLVINYMANKNREREEKTTYLHKEIPLKTGFIPVPQEEFNNQPKI